METFSKSCHIPEFATTLGQAHILPLSRQASEHSTADTGSQKVTKVRYGLEYAHA